MYDDVGIPVRKESKRSAAPPGEGVSLHHRTERATQKTQFGGRHVVLIVENNSVPFDRRMWNIARSLREFGADVSVICPRWPEEAPKQETLEGVHIYRYHNSFSCGTVVGYFKEYANAFLRTMFWMHVILWRRKIDAVHVANPPDLFWPLAIYLKLFRIPFIFDEHDQAPETYLSRFDKKSVSKDLLFRLLQLNQKLSYRFATCIISTNESYKRHALTINPKNALKTFVVRNGPDLRYFKPTTPNPALRDGRRYMAAYIGVMGFQDGVEYVIRAAAELVYHRHFSNFILYLIGNGDDWERLKQLSRNLEVDDFIVFTGRIPDAEALEILSTADICLSPDPSSPLNDVSTMTKVMEYMALGKGMVSFRLTENTMSARGAALYVNSNDHQAFAEGMQRLFEDDLMRSRMGTFGRTRVERSLSWQRQSVRLHAAYTFVLSDRRVAKRRELVVAPAT